MTKPRVVATSSPDPLTPEEVAVAQILRDVLEGLDYSNLETMRTLITEMESLLGKVEREIKVRFAQLRVLRYFEARLHSIHRDATAQYQAMVGAGPYPTFEDVNATRIAGTGGLRE